MRAVCLFRSRWLSMTIQLHLNVLCLSPQPSDHQRHRLVHRREPVHGQHDAMRQCRYRVHRGQCGGVFIVDVLRPTEAASLVWSDIELLQLCPGERAAIWPESQIVKRIAE